jgi:predicted phosphodiesterase
MRVFALSDIHVDYAENMAWIRALSSSDYVQDVLLLAGDACHEIPRLAAALTCLREKFAQVFFLNGNHELWLVGGDCSDSLQKFHRVLQLCRDLDIRTEPVRFDDGYGGVWIVPLFSWYDKPEEGKDSLFIPKSATHSEEMLHVWADDHFVKWPGVSRASTFFLEFNRSRLQRTFDAPVISFSHFLPRGDLMFPPNVDISRRTWPFVRGFNFSRVAGTWALDQQIRMIGSRVHAYGHQHRNRAVTIDGIAYVSHCLGYPQERKNGRIGYFEAGPRLIWDCGQPAF